MLKNLPCFQGNARHGSYAADHRTGLHQLACFHQSNGKWLFWHSHYSFSRPTYVTAILRITGKEGGGGGVTGKRDGLKSLPNVFFNNELREQERWTYSRWTGVQWVGESEKQLFCYWPFEFFCFTIHCGLLLPWFSDTRCTPLSLSLLFPPTQAWNRFTATVKVRDDR